MVLYVNFPISRYVQVILDLILIWLTIITLGDKWLPQESKEARTVSI